MRANVAPREGARLEALRNYRILDTGCEQSYDDITILAAHLCDVPIALISLVDVDRQWFKSKVGLEVSETSRDVSFCAHAILDEQILVVNDARTDDRFCDNPLVRGDPQIVFYAGVPLCTPESARIGTLCVIDHQPRRLSEVQIRSLEALARQVVLQLELKRVSDQLAGALERINVMEELIPICSYCKGIRNDQGYWQSVEAFIKSHDNVEFSHGVCNTCMEKYFPEVVPSTEEPSGEGDQH
ncbi:GAF domain-containing protein [Cyanobium sp. ATX 6A2]|jgi:GAF domain-containing protein|uniref:GAF domain-containing protein n=1 Tax=Cyanobium sp. ATX 6A2 TaxID=2823700 RepID=UPI0020CFCBCE|nr:GAF domain-containing protein [Cyanobium sp. ATX 6A2]MCP9887483.1 GAF domain-containing protein [Cyanobium sp. ATX 6A2]